MKVAVIGSRNLKINNLDSYLPNDTTEIVSGGAKGIDTYAREFALRNHLALTEFRPDYKRYGKGAPLKRSIQIIEYADRVIAFWDGVSKGTKFVIDACNKSNKSITVYLLSDKEIGLM